MTISEMWVPRSLPSLRDFQFWVVMSGKCWGTCGFQCIIQEFSLFPQMCYFEKSLDVVGLHRKWSPSHGTAYCGAAGKGGGAVVSSTVGDGKTNGSPLGFPLQSP